MIEPPTSEGGDPVVALKALPDGTLSTTHLEALRDGDTLDLVAPLVIDTHMSHVTHLDLVVDDTHYFVGWNPVRERWEQILVIVDAEDTIVLETAISVVDDETGESVLWLDPDSDPATEDIAEFIWEYVEYTHSETDRLFNVMDEAVEEL
ncbi:hypothetical protein [Halobacterium salinarum]|uniref:hypothetical protein n=1 Tax=Halobacterium salinarum TaxID=2242 RepID=UPI0025572592|nr:hypothetical protein [Halobacterium salinarum]MDL0126653.1 hypothetical protein [Halobacterium salinarum]